MSNATAVAAFPVRGDDFQRRVVDLQELTRNAPEYAQAWKLAVQLKDVLQEISEAATDGEVRLLHPDFENFTLLPLEAALPIRK